MIPGLYLLDSYILRVFLRTLLICFLSFTGLFIVIDVFGNLEEFLRYAEQNGPRVFLDYYGPRILVFFDQTSHLLVLISAMFVMTWMHRANELSAVMAAGVPKQRVVKPLLFAGLAIALIAAVNREVWIPKVRDQLTRNAQNWMGDQPRPFTPVFDIRTRILFTGKGTIPANQEIVQPTFQLPNQLANWGEVVVGEKAQYLAANADHRAGYLFESVAAPVNVDQLPTATLKGNPAILTSRNTTWLESGQVFVISDVTFEDLAYGRKFRRFLSTGELVKALRNASLDYGADTRVLLHSRMVQPLLDCSLLILGLPLVTRRKSPNVFLACGIAFGLVLLFLGVVMASHALGGYFLIRPASLAAWLPLFIFGPFAYVALRRGWE